MVELHIERFFEARRKTLQRRVGALRFGVADETHRHGRRYKLGQVTIRAGFVSGKSRRRRIVCGSFMTCVAGKRRVSLARVEKL